MKRRMRVNLENQCVCDRGNVKNGHGENVAWENNSFEFSLRTDACVLVEQCWRKEVDEFVRSSSRRNPRCIISVSQGFVVDYIKYVQIFS